MYYLSTIYTLVLSFGKTIRNYNTYIRYVVHYWWWGDGCAREDGLNLFVKMVKRTKTKITRPTDLKDINIHLG